jgi:DNA-binding Lrp family transcriptional regulator
MSVPARFDETDRKLLRYLQEDARQTNKDLAARVGLAPSSCLERVRRLQAAGLFRGFHAEVEPTALGVGIQALVAVRLSRHARETFDTFRAFLLERPEVVGVYHVTGGTDLQVHVAVRDAEHLRDLTLDGFLTRDEVDHIETALCYEFTRSPVWPYYGEE